MRRYVCAIARIDTSTSGVPVYTREDVLAFDERKLNDVLVELTKAQGKTTAALCEDPHMSDDGIDYIQGSLDLMYSLTAMLVDGTPHDLAIFLFDETEGDSLVLTTVVPMTACDGICPTLMEYFDAYHEQLDLNETRLAGGSDS
jgi:hypothetical protein